MIDTVICGDCLGILPDIPDASIDAVITDPPYPHIKRDYGYWTEAEWWAMVVEGVVPEVRRVLKPTGSAVFILQPNSRKVGSMRGWLWEFMYWVTEEWNMVQDVWWWNITALPMSGSNYYGLMRPSIKSCVWAGADDCYRKQENVLWKESKGNRILRTIGRAWASQNIEYSGTSRACNELSKRTLKARDAARIRGGVTPFNLIPEATDGRWGAGANGHGAGTPLKLADWWTRYIVPPGGTVLDPFFGVGTMGIAAIKNRCHFIGIEKEVGYCDTARERIAAAQVEHAQMELEL